MAARSNKKLEYGDFQTPRSLANRLCNYLAEQGCSPASIVEPTCGTGTFIEAALSTFPCATKLIGVERNPKYIDAAHRAVQLMNPACAVDLQTLDFFDAEWHSLFARLPEPILLIGNPPWVTSAGVGSLSGSNVPNKSNFLNLRGLDAKTGSSNFDIAEWMLMAIWECLRQRRAWLAMLIKTSVARRFLRYVWSRGDVAYQARLLPIDAMKLFGVSVDAGALVISVDSKSMDGRCGVYEDADWRCVKAYFGLRGNSLISDIDAYTRTEDLRASSPRSHPLRWRSGVKHDCAAVLELNRIGSKYFNQLGEEVDVEPEWVFPLLKGSRVARGLGDSNDSGNRYLIVTQRSTGDDTRALAHSAPRLWRYLNSHRERFEKRKSSIYNGRPEFSLFGIGPYTFKMWKIAICGLYKHFTFCLVSPNDGRPVVMDDTSYHLSFDNELSAKFVLELLESPPAKDFLAARVFWDSKRPITSRLLEQLDLVRLADRLGRADEWQERFGRTVLLNTVIG